MPLFRIDIPQHSPGVRVVAWASPSAAQPSTWRMLADRWTTRLRERAEMATMTARERKDAGLTAYDVERECSKPFWRDRP